MNLYNFTGNKKEGNSEIEKLLIEEFPLDFSVFLPNFCKDYIFNTGYESDNGSSENKFYQGVLSLFVNLIRQNYVDGKIDSYETIIRKLFGLCFDLELASGDHGDNHGCEKYTFIQPKIRTLGSRKKTFELISEVRNKDCQNSNLKYNFLI